jgi:hypothetical protein
MSERFNTVGLCFPGKHYMVNPLKRLTRMIILVGVCVLWFLIHSNS